MTNIEEILKYDPEQRRQPQPQPPPNLGEVLQFDPLAGQGGAPQPEPPPMTWRDALVRGFRNIPSSAWHTGKELVSAIAHPVETTKALGKTTAGMYQKLVSAPGEDEYVQYADMMIDFFQARYGSLEGFKQTMASDPVGIGLDVASVLVPMGESIRVAGGAAKISSITRAGNIITTTGKVIDPFSAALKSAALPFKLLPEGMATRLYKSGVKISSNLPKKTRDTLTRLALDEEIMPNISGLNMIRDKIDTINAEITTKIETATASGNMIPVDDLFVHFDELKAKYSLSGTPVSNWKKIDKVKSEILKANETLERRTLTPAEAQKLKQRIYKETAGYYASIKESPASIQAQQTVARTAKEALETIYPEIKELNAYEGSLIELHTEIEKAAERILNRDLIGIHVPLKGGLGALLGAKVGAVLGISLGLLDTPSVKAKIALVTHRLRTKGIKVRTSSAILRQLGVKGTEARKEFDYTP